MNTSLPVWCAPQRRLLDGMRAWTDQSIKHQWQTPFQGIHDEGTFTTSWDSYHMLTGDAKILEFMTWLRDGLADYVDQELFHGYYQKGEVHHQPEPFTHFAARFRTLVPDDPTTARLLNDVAHHIGNWEDGVPDWYDWNNHRFISYRIGSVELPDVPPFNYEEPDHFRLPMMAFVAYLTTGQSRYLDLCIDYADRWAKKVLDHPIPNVVLFHDRPEFYDDILKERAEKGLQPRVELLLASGAVDLYLDLFHVTGDERYREVVERTIPTLVETVADPRNRLSAATLAKYRRISGKKEWDAGIMEQLPPVSDFQSRSEIDLLDLRDRDSLGRGPNPDGWPGHRVDQFRMGTVGSDGYPEESSEPTPPAWALAWAITGDDQYAAQAFGTAATRLETAMRSLKDGREHGCAARTISAVASGHGRDDRWGDVNSILGPLTLGSVRFGGAETPAIEIGGGLPDQVSILVSDQNRDAMLVTLANCSEADIDIALSAIANGSKPTAITLRPHDSTTVPLSQSLSDQLRFAVVDAA